MIWYRTEELQILARGEQRTLQQLWVARRFVGDAVIDREWRDVPVVAPTSNPEAK